jgi:uncharacterized protein involved in exopolysaccharide biosynthesis
MCGLLTAALAAVCWAGCQQQPRQETPDLRQARLRAVQDADLQKQLTAREAEIKTLQEKHAQELRVRDQELIRCKVRISELERDLRKGIDERIKSVTAPVLNENTRLRQDVEQLRAEIEKLKKAAGQ